MSFRICIVALLSAVLPVISGAQQPSAQPHLRTAKVPDVLYAQIPQLKPGAGVVVLSDPQKSIAGNIGLHQYDIVLSCKGAAVKSGRQFLDILNSHSGPDAIPIVVMRGGKLQSIEVSREKLDQYYKNQAKSSLKPGGPPPLRVTAEPLEEGRFKVNFHYYVGSGKMVRLERSGTLAEIRRHVKLLNVADRMPANICDLAVAVLDHIRQSTSSKKATP